MLKLLCAILFSPWFINISAERHSCRQLDRGLWSLCILQNKSLLTKLFTHVNDSFLQACDIPLDTRLEMLQVDDGICYKLPGAMKSNKSTSVCFSKVST